MSYAPTEAEVEALALRLAKLHCASAEAPLIQEYGDALWLLRHYEPRSDEQRCDGSGTITGTVGITPNTMGGMNLGCPGCSRCKPRETPKSDGGLAASEFTVELMDGATESAAPVHAPLLSPTHEYFALAAADGNDWSALLANIGAVVLDILAELQKGK